MAIVDKEREDNGTLIRDSRVFMETMRIVEYSCVMKQWVVGRCDASRDNSPSSQTPEA